MRIAYGVFGYGRGHATRAAAVLKELTQRHETLVIAGGDAFDHLSQHYPVYRIPTLGYAYSASARRSNYRTIRQNSWHVLDILFRGPVSQQLTATLADFRPDVVISDAEPWTHRAARRLRIPRIGFDHFGILAHCRVPLPWADWFRSFRDVWIYRTLMGRPQRVVVSSFYSAPRRWDGVEVIGPLLREEVHGVQPSLGEHYLCYLNKGQHQLTLEVEQALRCIPAPVLVYGTERRGVSGNLDFRPPSSLPFIEDLARCRAVISTAGNQLVGEALHFGKPLLVMPEDCVEQRLNASAVERLGIGMRTSMWRISPGVIEKFLRRESELRAATSLLAIDGRADALRVIERFLNELSAPVAAAGGEPIVPSRTA